MATGVIEAADVELRESVVRQLETNPEVDTSAIGITADEGVVTLTGFVATYGAKLEAERTVKRIFGVRAVVNDLQVKLLNDRTDPDIAHDALDSLRARLTMPERVKLTIRNGHITLEGAVDWYHEKMAAENAVKYLKGVRGVNNYVQVKPQRVSAEQLRNGIEDALRRAAVLDARRVRVHVDGSRVTLSGNVSSWAERREAERAVWAIAGVSVVTNEIQIVP